VVIAQSLAILRYIGKLGNLYPEDPIQAMEVDSMLDTLADCAKPIEMTVQGPVKFLIDDEAWSKSKVLEIRNRITNDKQNGLPFYLGYFEKVLNANPSGWLVGNTVTIADLQLHRITSWVSSGMLDGIPKTILDDYPLVKVHNENIEALPSVVKWRTEHPTPYQDFQHTPPSE